MAADKNTRNDIIQKGAELIHLKGFNASGIQEILDRTGVPKGSFYFYFKSKDDFGLEVIDYFSSLIEGFFRHHLDNRSVHPIDRLTRLMNFYGSLFKKQNYTLGCPIGNLSLEMADINERFRLRLNNTVNNLISLIKSCLEEAKQDGSISKDRDIAEAARFIFYGFEGAVLHMKLVKDITPVKTFQTCIYQYLGNKAAVNSN